MIYEELIYKLEDFKIYDRVTMENMDNLCDIYWSSVVEQNRPVYYTTESDGSIPGSHQELLKKLLTPRLISIYKWDDASKTYLYTDLTSHPLLERSSEDSVDFGLGKIQRLILNNRRYLSEQYRDELDYGDDYYSDVTFTHEQNAEFIKSIKTGLSSVVYFETDLYKCTTNEDGSKSIEPIVGRGWVGIYDPYKSNGKKIAASTTPFISDIPKTKAGTKYSGSKSFKNVLNDGFGNIIPPDNVIDPHKDLGNYKSGFLDINYNSNTGKYESGTRQILARAIVDIPGCSTPEIDTNNVDPKEYYKNGYESNQVGDFDINTNSGKAVTLNVQKGNPYLFGPNFINKTEHDEESSTSSVELETILVINRTPISFKANELMICSLIDGEWIPQKFVGGEGSSTTFSIKNWTFQKMISNSDSYFRDNRYYSNIDSEDFDASSYENIVISPESYQQKMRNKFYVDLYNRTSGGSNALKQEAALNFNPLVEQTVEEALEGVDDFIGNKALWDIQPSVRYWQFTAFDQMGEFAGGKNEKNIIARTNRASAPNGLPDDESPESRLWIEWWGPSFVDGYKSNEVQELLSKKDSIAFSGVGLNADSYYSSYQGSSENPAIVDASPGRDLDRNWSLNYEEGMFANTSDTSALNLPAEVATNSAPSETSITSPLEDSKLLIENYGCSYLDMIDSTNAILEVDENTNTQKRFTWLYNTDGGIDDSLYGLQPNVPNKIDFFSLTAEVVSSTDYDRETSGSNVTRDYGNETLMSRHLATPKYPDHLLGSDFVFSRNNHCGIDAFPESSIPYNDYVKKRSTGGVGDLSPPQIWEDETADCVGIIASRCKIKFKGTELRFLMDQQFGLPPFRQVSLGQSSSFTFLPIGGLGLALTAPGTLGFENTYPRWGGATDNPQDFHTTALHAKIYDAWPTEQTIYDARYFTTFHFNPGVCLSEAENENGVDLIGTEVDFRVPTSSDGEIIDQDTELDSTFEISDPSEWRVNTIRRGMMLNNGGFKYIRNYIGISDSYEIVDGGSNYSIGDTLSIVGGNGSDGLAQVSGVNSEGSITDLIILNRGSGYLPSDFYDGNSPNTSKVKIGGDVDIYLTKGVVWGNIEYDDYPRDRSGTIQLTEGNNRGYGNNDNGFVSGYHEKSFIFNETNDSGEYDIFLFYHNDITHTVYSADNYFYSAPQHVLLEINAV